jgi:hypothetical protein
MCDACRPEEDLADLDIQEDVMMCSNILQGHLEDRHPIGSPNTI